MNNIKKAIYFFIHNTYFRKQSHIFTYITCIHKTGLHTYIIIVCVLLYISDWCIQHTNTRVRIYMYMISAILNRKYLFIDSCFSGIITLETQDPADPWCWCIKFKTPTESFFRDVIFVKWTCIPHTALLFIFTRKLHITVIQRDAIQSNVFPIESLIPCLYATRELASYNVTSSESNLPLSQGCSRKDIKSDGRLFL